MEINTQELKASKLAVASGEARHFFATDIGSTGTRTFMFDQFLETGESMDVVELEVAADYAIIHRDIDHISSASTMLIDNLEICIKDITPGSEKQDKAFDSRRVVKGSLMKANSLPVERSTSGVMKSRQETTFVNWIISIGLHAYASAVRTGENPEKLTADVTIAIPPEDKKSQKNIDFMKDRFFGVYVFELPRLHYKITINVPKESIFIEDEASANIRCWATYRGKDVRDYANVLCGDAGGRSHDTALMQDGILITDVSKTGRFGGTNKFPQFISNAYTSEYGEEPAFDVIMGSLETGYARDAAKTNFTKYIMSGKDEFAKLIWQDFLSVMDAANLRPSQIPLVLLSGNMYKSSVKDGVVTVPSLHKTVEKIFNAISPKTHVSVIEEANPIVWGLIFYRISEMA